ncbi:MAG TPA: hypothetical protein VMR70_04275 [Flavisolibacter sp.]|nr:hypothetical protein [Flavisolibacter sp.]
MTMSFKCLLKQLTNCIILILLIVPVNSYCQGRKDTTFLHRAIENGEYHAIFLDRENSSYHNELSEGFVIDTFIYNDILQNLKDSGKRMSYFPIGLDRDWYSLHQYKQKYYAYLPSEPYVNLYIRITDSTIIMNDFNDGLIPAFIQNIEWVNAKTLKIYSAGLYKEHSVIIFHFLTTAKNLAVVEFPNADEKFRFNLLATKKKLKDYPIIVNHSPNGRAHEWEFERIDFEALLK